VTTTTGHRVRRGRIRRGAIAASAAAIAACATLAGCASSSSSSAASGDSAASSAPTPSSAPTTPLATSLSTSTDSWAIVPMSSNPTFWEVFVRPAKSATWQLVTPPGVADNGGLVAAAGAGSGLTVAVRPSQDLQFTPVSATADAGANWSADGPISEGVAASPDALAVSGRQLAAVLDNGTVEASSDAGSSWRTLAKPGTIAASAAAHKCGAVHVSSVSFGPVPTQVLAAGECGATGAAGLFAYSAGGGWQRVSLPVSGPLVRLGPGTALVRAADGLTALWADDAPHWYAYAPLSSSATPTPTSSAAPWTASAALPVTNAVTASGGLAGATATSSGGTWVLLPGGQAATIGGPGQQWLLLPPTPAHTSVLASGPGTSIDALAVSGSRLTVWQLDRRSTVWARAQTIAVPIQLGSSS
jgi:hypothetical protein